MPTKISFKNWREEKEFLRRKYKQDKLVKLKELRELKNKEEQALIEFEYKLFLKQLGIKCLK